MAKVKKATKRRSKLITCPEQIYTSNKEFYSTPAWRRLRYDILRQYPRCLLCGNGVEEGARLNVDHIKPRRTHPELAMDPDNLQTLCARCNMGKGSRYEDDWR